MRLAARAVVDDPVDGRMGGARQALEPAERRERGRASARRPGGAGSGTGSSLVTCRTCSPCYRPRRPILLASPRGAPHRPPHARSATSRTSPGPGSSSRTSCPSWRTPRPCTRRSTTSPSGPSRETSTSSSAPRRADSSSGAALAYKLGCGFVAARKPGKLPFLTVGAKYALEYGFDALEMHVDALKPGHAGPRPRRSARHRRHRHGPRSTSSSSWAPRSSAWRSSSSSRFLNGRDKLYGHDVHSLLQYESE